MQIRKQKDYTKIDWGGGSSTEIFIYPEGANYKELNFDFRLSTATVEAEYSVFSQLPSVSRKLLLLQGEFELVHEGHHSSRLTPGNVDTFEGDWKTESFGTGVDFNLMMRNGVQGDVSLLTPQRGEQHHLENEDMDTYLFVFSGDGDINGVSFVQGDLIKTDNKKTILSASSNCMIVQVFIKK
jgi:environmental stress-induced protein Ves